MKAMPPDDASPGPVIPQGATDDRAGPSARHATASQARPRRQRSVRVLLALLFVIPLASLLALWGFAASVTLSNAIQAHNFNTENGLYGGWAQTVVTQLAQERLQSFQWLSSGRGAPQQPVLKQERATDRSEERRVGKEGRSRWSPYH